MNSLIERVRTGDKKAVLEFYKTFSPIILTGLKNKVNDKEAVNELLNEIFLDAIDAIHFFDEKNNIQAWLHRISNNKIANFHNKRRIKSVLLSQIPFLQIVKKEINQTGFQLEKNKIRDSIENALHNISKRYRKILKLRYEDKTPVKQIALRLNLSFKATESLLFRARRRFKLAYTYIA